MWGLLMKLTRKKNIEVGPSDTSLQRCLTTFDLTLLAIGGMVGSGIYVMTGVAAKELAGPAIVVSFLLAAAVISLIVVCFIEFASRIHKTGTTYLYAYTTLGELPAFLIGWCILLTTVFGAATNARAWSAYLDFLTGHAIADWMRANVADWSMVGAPLSSQPDLLAASVALILALVVAGGANCSSRVNTVCALVNVMVLVFFIVIGFAHADLTNWMGEELQPLANATASPSLSPPLGFLPYGWAGVLRGAAACFWALTGFEAIAMSVEEAHSPTQSVPLASAVAVVAVTALYMATAAAMTLVTPVALLDVSAPLPSALSGCGLVWAGRLAAVGPLFGITTTTLGSLFAFVRVAYAIATDGLLCPVFARINACSRVPCGAVFVSGIAVSLLATFLDIRDLLGFGILLALTQYTVVALSVIVLRYRPPWNADQDDASFNTGTLRLQYHWLPLQGFAAGRWVHIATLVITGIMLPLSAALLHLADADDVNWWVLVTVVSSLLVVCLSLAFSIHAHQQNGASLTLQVPFVPWLPLLAIFGCMLLIVSVATKQNMIGLITVSILGLFIYFSYGCRHSRLNQTTLIERPIATETIELLQGTSDDENDSPSG